MSANKIESVMGFISIKNVCFTYPREEKFALEDINLTIEQGEFLAVMGENGAGKTTFCKLFNGIVPNLTGGRFSGTVTIDGLCTGETSVPQMALNTGMVLNDPDTQVFSSSVRHEAAFGPENIRLPAPEIEKRVTNALCAVGLGGFEDRAPSTLSGGEKQRLSIAAALAMKGKILVLDEPLCRLDPDGAGEVMSVLKSIREKFRITVIMASHNSRLMAEHADRICLLKNGRIAALGNVKSIFADRQLSEENGIEPINNDLASAEFQAAPFCGSAVINIKDFTFKYPNGISIENINLSVAENDFIAIIGKNGCGKTTLLKSIAGLLRPSSGDIYIRGKNTKQLSVSEISREAGFVMQNPDHQLFTDSVYKEVSFALKNMRLSKTEINKRVKDALEDAGIKEPDAFPHALSRADRTRTVIACILAMNTKIILFDEADAGNDYKGNIQIMELAKKLHSKGYTIIFVTHNLSLASGYAHRLIKMDRKGIVFDGRRN